MSGGKRKAGADATGCQPQLLPGVLPAADNGGENGDSATPALCLGEPATKKRRVMFQDVTVYYFNRRQGFICVPSQVYYVHITFWRFGLSRQFEGNII